ncbi:MAG: tetratricopeptide repeat protein [Firmicutes bacterium]|nr:tetratricopeptide repeat protein [Bacillota bacterium]
MVRPRTLAALAQDRAFGDLDPAQVCFIDTETTGLAGGTGTHVFLVGVGSFSGGHFVVDQYFMEDYDREPALLEALDDALGGFRAVVTFNGRAFDIPLLETRFVLSRRRPSLAALPHLDLLPLARRLWGPLLGSCRLVALEEAVLGEHRVGDIPGHVIPVVYFRYLRDRDASLLGAVFAHNRQDVLSMVSLLGRLAEQYEAHPEIQDPGASPWAPAPSAGEGYPSPLGLYGLGRLYQSTGREPAAASCYRAALAAGLPEPFASRAARECVRLLRRLGRWAEVTDLCRALADGPPPNLWALVELAKELEHRARDYARALSVVDRALGLTDPDGAGRPGSPHHAEGLRLDLIRRRARLERRRRSGPHTA